MVWGGPLHFTRAPVPSSRLWLPSGSLLNLCPVVSVSGIRRLLPSPSLCHILFVLLLFFRSTLFSFPPSLLFIGPRVVGTRDLPPQLHFWFFALSWQPLQQPMMVILTAQECQLTQLRWLGVLLSQLAIPAQCHKMWAALLLMQQLVWQIPNLHWLAETPSPWCKSLYHSHLHPHPTPLQCNTFNPFSSRNAIFSYVETKWCSTNELGFDCSQWFKEKAAMHCRTASLPVGLSLQLLNVQQLEEGS